MFHMPQRGKPRLLAKWLPRLGKEAQHSFVQTLKGNKPFAEAMLKHYDLDELRSFVAPQEKQASGEADLVVISNPDSDKAAKLGDKEREILLKDGVYLKDTRSDTSTVFNENLVAKTLQTPHKAGLYDVLMADGSYKTLS